MLANATFQQMKDALTHRNRERAHSHNSSICQHSLAAHGRGRGVALPRDLARSGSPGDWNSRDRSVLLAANLDVSHLVLLIPRIRQHHGIGDRGKGHVQCDGGRRPMRPGNRRRV